MYTYLVDMRIRLSELRKVIRRVLREASQDRPTISAQLDPGEKELAAKYPKWGSPEAAREKLKHDSPTEVKAKKVAAILQAKGLTADAAMKKKVTHELRPYIDKMDPADAFVMSADDVAVKFAEDVLGVKPD